MSNPINLIIVLVVAFSPLVIYALLCIRKNKSEKDDDAWETTTARLTGDEEAFTPEDKGTHGFYKAPDQKTEYQIVYTVDGVEYTKYINETEAAGSKNGTVRIKYYKKRPQRFKVM